MSTTTIIEPLEKEIMRELSKEAHWLGEDGNMTCVAKTEKAAKAKFIKLMKDCVGNSEASDLRERLKQPNSIGIGWLHLFTEEESRKHEDAEWYVSVIERSPFEVWKLNV